MSLDSPKPHRDLAGYGGKPPMVRWPNGAAVAVSFVVNFEEGAEFTISGGDDHNETIYEVHHRLDGPDPCIESHFEYGTRAAWWRVMDLFDHYQAKVTVSACGLAVERSPQLAADAIARGHEVSAHGWRWQSHAGMAEAAERACIARTVEAITKATGGKRPLGWHTRSASSANTRRLLMEEGGFLYDSDAYNDDLPFVVTDGAHRHVVLPYAFDTNDMQFQNTQRFQGATDFAAYVTDAYDWLAQEGRTAPRMLSIGLHLRMIGRPGRIGALDRILAHITHSGAAWIAPRAEIAKYWLAATSA
ncbi:polysaccharide deacetylase family protein [Ferrovibrio terrae]|uniref:polysaccharide deacetylase family protein n=1 Tax=Ferrovibrio terrae TaxID=2594003 RepID=UPI0031377983